MKTLTTHIREAFRLRDDTKFPEKRVIKTNYDLCTYIRQFNVEDALNLSGIDVSQMVDMSNVFEGTNFKTINVTGWDTSNVELMNNMFAKCKRLERIIGIENFDVKKVKQTQYMFSKCEKLKSIDLSEWRPESLEYANNMFEHCVKLKTTGDLCGWKMLYLKSMKEMFLFDYDLEDIGDVTDWPRYMKTMCNCAEMFFRCDKLKDNESIPDWY